jgi:uncharacterized phage protein (TIGR01671 family)
MQDRFQFRVWKDKENRMVYGVTYLNPLLLDPKIDPENAQNKLMQCTGLKDVNGNLIYENDIVKTLYTKPNGEVINRNCTIEYNRGAFWINYGIGASYLYNDNCTYEIIGNVFQDKELLNEKI